MTEIAITNLVEWYNQVYSSDLRTFPIACEFVYRFLATHPFQDGNERVGRGLFLLLLLQSRNIALSTAARYISIDRIIEKHKEEYYFVLNRCSQGTFKQDTHECKIHSFMEFMLKVISESLDSIDIYRKKYHAIQILPDSAQIVLQCFKEHPQTHLRNRQITQETGLSWRTVAYALSILTRQELLQRTGRGPSTKYKLTS